MKETKNKIVSLIKLSDPESLTSNLLDGHNMIFIESLFTMMENFTRLELKFSYTQRVVYHINESYSKKLKVLHVSGGELANIDLLTSLVDFKLDYVKVTEEELQKIASLPQLKKLHVHGGIYGDYGDFGKFIFSSGLEELEELGLYDCYIDENIFQYLKRLGRLRKLSLKYTGLTDALLRNVSNLRELIELDISCNNITDLGLKHVSNLTKLTKLDISDTFITDAGMEYLVHLGNLKVLHLTAKINNWSSLHQPKEHPLTRLLAAGCFVNHNRSTNQYNLFCKVFKSPQNLENI